MLNIPTTLLAELLPILLLLKVGLTRWYMPGTQVIVVDEIGSSEEVRAVKSIAQRGVMLVGTAHGVSLSSLIGNPELNTLVGGVHQVVVGDMQAKYVL